MRCAKQAAVIGGAARPNDRAGRQEMSAAEDGGGSPDHLIPPWTKNRTRDCQAKAFAVFRLTRAGPLWPLHRKLSRFGATEILATSTAERSCPSLLGA